MYGVIAFFSGFRIGPCCHCGPDELVVSGDGEEPGFQDVLPHLDITIPTLDGMWACAFTEFGNFTGVDVLTPGDGSGVTGIPVMG